MLVDSKSTSSSDVYNSNNSGTANGEFFRASQEVFSQTSSGRQKSWLILGNGDFWIQKQIWMLNTMQQPILGMNLLVNSIAKSICHWSQWMGKQFWWTTGLGQGEDFQQSSNTTTSGASETIQIIALVRVLQSKWKSYPKNPPKTGYISRHLWKPTTWFQWFKSVKAQSWGSGKTISWRSGNPRLPTDSQRCKYCLEQRTLDQNELLCPGQAKHFVLHASCPYTMYTKYHRYACQNGLPLPPTEGNLLTPARLFHPFMLRTISPSSSKSWQIHDIRMHPWSRCSTVSSNSQSNYSWHVFIISSPNDKTEPNRATCRQFIITRNKPCYIYQQTSSYMGNIPTPLISWMSCIRQQHLHQLFKVVVGITVWHWHTSILNPFVGPSHRSSTLCVQVLYLVIFL